MPQKIGQPKPLDPTLPMCRSCHERNALKGKRGLCWRCYKSADRSLFPLDPDCGHNGEPEPTAEELEAIIAERMQNLPKWWHHKQAAHGDGEMPRALPHAVSRGRVINVRELWSGKRRVAGN